MVQSIHECVGARELAAIGFRSDVEVAASLDVSRVVPTLVDGAFSATPLVLAMSGGASRSYAQRLVCAGTRWSSGSTCDRRSASRSSHEERGTFCSQCHDRSFALVGRSPVGRSRAVRLCARTGLRREVVVHVCQVSLLKFVKFRSSCLPSWGMELNGFVPRRVSEILAEQVQLEPVMALHGPRSVGKSTVLRGSADRWAVR